MMDSSDPSIATVIFRIALFVANVAALWRILTKAGQPGWAILIPFFNIYVLLKIAGMSGWTMLLLLIPFVNIVVAFLANLGISRRFGHDVPFALGLLLLPPIFVMILGFGSDRYVGKPPVIVY